eukprot:TRINITY_DN3068_c0_g1_i1.p1 TRINITY_DN3068_c0_g1~~TRINITY_DN3068_c0_g1_i1.p1  ORF type:complete len:738 (+),score=113.18 TRINITY_DN3068_c0_g1_i1:41-2215(+)
MAMAGPHGAARHDEDPLLVEERNDAIAEVDQCITAAVARLHSHHPGSEDFMAAHAKIAELQAKRRRLVTAPITEVVEACEKRRVSGCCPATLPSRFLRALEPGLRSLQLMWQTQITEAEGRRAIELEELEERMREEMRAAVAASGTQHQASLTQVTEQLGQLQRLLLGNEARQRLSGSTNPWSPCTQQSEIGAGEAKQDPYDETNASDDDEPQAKRRKCKSNDLYSIGAPRGLFVMDIPGRDDAVHLYVSDSENCRVVRYSVASQTGIKTEATLVSGGNGPGDKPDQLNLPYGIWVSQHRTVFVADHQNDRVMRWEPGAKQGVVAAGGNGRGNGMHQLCNPTRIVLLPDEALLVGDGNGRVVKWAKGAAIGVTLITCEISPICCLDDESLVTVDEDQLLLWARSNSLYPEKGSPVVSYHKLSEARAVRFDSDSNSVLVADTGNNRILQLFLPSSASPAAQTTRVTSVECEVEEAEDPETKRRTKLNGPRDVQLHRGYLFVADTLNGRVLRVPHKVPSPKPASLSQGESRTHNLVLDSKADVATAIEGKTTLVGLKVKGPLSDPGLLAISRWCPKLEKLRGYRGEISAAGLRQCHFPALRALGLRGTTDSLVVPLSHSCPNITLLDISHSSKLTGSGFDGATFSRLVTLTLADCDGVTDTNLVTVAKSCPALKTLVVQGCTNISNLGVLKVIDMCTGLDEIYTRGCGKVTSRNKKVTKEAWSHPR